METQKIQNAYAQDAYNQMLSITKEKIVERIEQYIESDKASDLSEMLYKLFCLWSVSSHRLEGPEESLRISAQVMWLMAFLTELEEHGLHLKYTKQLQTLAEQME